LRSDHKLRELKANESYSIKTNNEIGGDGDVELVRQKSGYSIVNSNFQDRVFNLHFHIKIVHICKYQQH
jgi:hypothetical protein